ncbi:TBC1 domain family member 14 [Trypanosoma conorhini]|uniref:TBC1 domain family member 14 n=1 Tax=Trypanosoma conorhini TaxID=83891 RepID=A0A422QC37_9TRYP|nr:TBC1 domain family member 14 [Trypanosoma conorhini]RNF27553.1 TBC1 domain family member 14 [Trypanosoma conorhini]
MLHVGLLSTAEEINAVSGRMVGGDVPAKDLAEAQRHMRLIQRLRRTQRQRYVREAQAMQQQRRQRRSAAAYWEAALANFAKTNRAKLCSLVLGCGTPPLLRLPTWVMALGNARKLARADFEAAQRKALDRVREEEEAAAAQDALNGFPAAAVNLPFGKCVSRIAEELAGELPRPQRRAQGAPNVLRAKFPSVRGTAAVDQENTPRGERERPCGASAGGAKPPLPISECRVTAFLGVTHMEEANGAADEAAGATTPVACDNNSTRGVEEEEGENHGVTVSRSPSFSNVSSCLRKNSHDGAETAVDSFFSSFDPNAMTPMQVGDDEERDLFLSSLLSEGVLRQVELLLRTHMELRPEVGYVKGMSCLAMMLAVVVTDPWELCVCFSSLVEYAHLGPFLRRRQQGVILHLDIFDAVLQKAQPALYALLQQYGVPLNSCLLDWWNTVFLGTLPYAAALRAWDLFLLDEHYLYRITLALLVYRFGLHTKAARRSLPQSYHSQQDLQQALNPSISETYMNQQLLFRIMASDELCGIRMRSIRSIVERVSKVRFSH